MTLKFWVHLSARFDLKNNILCARQWASNMKSNYNVNKKLPIRQYTRALRVIPQLWTGLFLVVLVWDQTNTKPRGEKSAWRGSTLSNSGLKASHTVKLTAEPGLFLNVKKIHFLFLNIWIHKFNQFNDHIDAFVIILNITALKIIFIHMIFWCVAQWVSETLSWCISSVLSCMRVNVEVHNSKDSASSERIRLLVDGYFLPLCSCLFFCKAQLHTRRLNC